MTADHAHPEKRGLSLSLKTLFGLLAGAACGLFFAELCGWLQPLGDAFVGLLQMTVLPYISISLIASVGRLSPQQARHLGGRVGLILLAIWAMGMLTVVMMAMAFPPRQSAAFYSSAILETPAAPDLKDVFIPSNPFRALARNWIPAVVVFCLGLGIAVIALPNKGRFLVRLDDWLEVLRRVNGYVVRLTPYGVFAIVAAVTGTITIEEMARIQAYLLSYTVAILVLTFLLLPVVVTACTPFRYRDILAVTLEAMITVLATAKLIIVLPLLIERTKSLFADYGHDGEDVRSGVDVVYPLIYPIPNLGKLLTLIFIPFTAWFVGSPLAPIDYPRLFGLGSMAYFSGPLVAISFLLDAFHLPADMMQLFVLTSVYCARIGDLLAAMHLCTVTVLGTCAAQGLLRVRLSRLVAGVGVSLAVTAIALLGLRAWLARSTSAGPSKGLVVAQMQMLNHPLPATVHRSPPTQPAELPEGISHLDAIRDSGVLRVGYLSQRLPYSYFNERGELVGFDIEMAHMLAEELGCRLEFIPFAYPGLDRALDANHFDFALGGLPITTSSLLAMRFSTAYLDASLSFVVRDHRQKDFSSFENIQRQRNLRIAVPRNDYFRSKIESRFPDVTAVPIDGAHEFFNDREEAFDALLIDAESGSAWTFLYPGFRPVVPKDLNAKLPLAFAIKRQDRELSDFLSRWIEMKVRSGELEPLYRHWILGETDSPRPPRWSILRNVLGIGAD